MSEHSAIVSWKRKNSEALTDNQYSRAHIWEFDGGSKILASASPHVVPIPLSVEAHVDPEEAFVRHYQVVICWSFYLLQQSKDILLKVIQTMPLVF